VARTNPKPVPKVIYASRASVQNQKKSAVIERELDSIYKKHGTVTQKLILDEAQDPNHPLHQYFEWDDSIAAQKFRLHQALQMIQATRFIAFIGQPQSPPPLVDGTPVRKLISEMKRGGGFILRPQALDDAEIRAALMERKKGQLRSWCREAVDIDELKPLRDAIEALL